MAKKKNEITSTFEIDGESYDLRYDMDAIDRFERTAGASLMSVYSKSMGMFTIAQLKALITIGIVKISGETIGNEEKKKAVDYVIRTMGYAMACGMVSVAIERDCGFLFQGV